MRVLFVAHGASHVPWAVPLAWATQLAGHEVRIAARPQSVDRVKAAGLVAVPVGRRDAGDAFAGWRIPDAAERPERLPDDWPMGPLDWPEERRLSWGSQLIGLADSLADDVVAFARAWRPDLVVYDIGAVAGLVGAAAAGVPAVGFSWCQPVGLYFLDEKEVPPAYLRMFQRFGLEPRIGTDTWIDPCPPALRRPSRVPRVPVRYTPYNGPGEVPDWLLRTSGRPRVCVTGGITTTNFNDRQPQLLDELAGLDAEVLLAVKDLDTGGRPLPDNVRPTGWVPLGVLLQGCRALVHHGGAGSGMTGLAHGIPQIVVPETDDNTQWLWGDLMADSGAGINLDRSRQAEPGALAAAVTAVLEDPGHTERARAIQAEIQAMPAPAELVGYLESRAAA
ncbi:nucleotide disphospho-sugar-binding domain-containing protein [Streptomyces sp. NPDC017993]|uniref:nucleotide disphospho-sugar-binding domain-containing protein n=1 Tax=Streptomyces sp. NPDC017993 TaxID=3365027 RepID=UPI0037901BB3